MSSLHSLNQSGIKFTIQYGEATVCIRNIIHLFAVHVACMWHKPSFI